MGLKFAQLEKQYCGVRIEDIGQLSSQHHISADLIRSAIEIKKALGQINEVIHAAGIIILLPSILEQDETIEYISLGAGNTGKKFDLETNLRIAEFKFITWREKSNTIRENQLFKDFFYLSEAETTKSRYLYVMDLKQPLKFFSGGRSILSSVCSRNATLAKDFADKFGSRFVKVNEYFHYRKGTVQIIDVNKLMPDLAQTLEELP